MATAKKEAFDDLTIVQAPKEEGYRGPMVSIYLRDSLIGLRLDSPSCSFQRISIEALRATARDYRWL